MGLITSFGPMATAAPSVHDLHRRNETEALRVISVATDEICGYISGRQGASLACAPSAYCVFGPPAKIQTPSHGRVVCCDEESCDWYTTCINSKEYFSSSKCVDGCEVDNVILKCTDSKYPYCNTISFAGNTIDYSCNDIDITTAMSAALSYSGQEERTFATLDEKQYESLMAQMESEEAAATRETTATKTSAPSASATDDNSDSGGSSNHTGAIVGGVVGGVGALALVGVAILLFLRLRKKKKAQAAAAPPAYQAGAENKGQYLDPTQTTSPNSGYSQPIAGYQSPPPQNVICEAEAEVKDNKPQELADNRTKKKEAAPVELA